MQRVVPRSNPVVQQASSRGRACSNLGYIDSPNHRNEAPLARKLVRQTSLSSEVRHTSSSGVCSFPVRNGQYALALCQFKKPSWRTRWECIFIIRSEEYKSSRRFSKSIHACRSDLQQPCGKEQRSGHSPCLRMPSRIRWLREHWQNISRVVYTLVPLPGV